MDNLANFAKRAPVKLRNIWKKNFQIDESEITSRMVLKDVNAGKLSNA
jgi:hypothetical protein